MLGDGGTSSHVLLVIKAWISSAIAWRQCGYLLACLNVVGSKCWLASARKVRGLRDPVWDRVTIGWVRGAGEEVERVGSVECDKSMTRGRSLCMGDVVGKGECGEEVCMCSVGEGSGALWFGDGMLG